MTHPAPAIDAARLLGEEAYVRRLARALLFDEHGVDDVVQQTWIDALRDAPRDADRPTLRAWLATVVQRKAKRARFRAARHDAHERAAARAERPLPSADELIEREELRRTVVAELNALPEPYRTTLAQRYLDGAQPSEIARQEGVPASTVRARVRRGLAMLRDALDRRHGDDRRAWSLALLPLAAPAKAGAAAGMAATSILLSLGIAMKLLLSSAALVALAAFAWVLWPAAPDEPDPAPSPAGATTADETATISTAAQRTRATATSDRVPVTVPPPGPPLPGVGPALVHGRCVDTAGNPVAGARITLQGAARDVVAASTWELRHGSVDWQAPEPAVSGTDGHFELEFLTVPSFAFRLAIEHDALVGRAMSLVAPAPSEERDVGDLHLSEGYRVRGRVVDTTGTPVADVHVAVVPFRGNRGVIAAEPLDAGQPVAASAQDVTPDGQFATRVLPPGRYGLRVYHREIIEPGAELALTDADLDLRIVVETRAAHEAHAILGTVVDDMGIPVHGAAVHTGVIEPFDLRAFGSATYTDQDGRFILRPSASIGPDGDPTVVSAWRDGYRAACTPEPVARGTRGVRLRLQRGPALTVRVNDASSGDPIPRFGIRLEPIRPGPGKTTADLVLRAAGDHADGVATLRSVTPFRYRLTVVPADASRWSPSSTVEIDTTDGQPRHVAIQVPSFAMRDLHVVDPSGAPIAGAPVEVLIAAAGGVVTPRTIALPPEAAAMASGDVATHVGDAITDDDGIARLSGPAAVDVHLRLPGPAHVPTVVGPVRLDEDAPLEVRVRRGVTVVGTLRPRQVVDALRAESRDAGGDLGLVLRGLGSRSGEALPPGLRSNSDPFAIGEDGSFRLTGVPPGTWRLDLRYRERQQAGTTAGRSHSIVAEFRVTPASAQPLDVDVSHLAKHPVDVRVIVDGEPALAAIYAAAHVDAGAGAGTGARSTNVSTNSGGIATLALEAGRWTVQPVVHVGRANVALDARAVDVGAGGVSSTTVDFNVRLARRAVRILRPDGTPAAGVVLETRDRANDDTRVQTEGQVFHLPRWQLQPAAAPTDQSGRSELRWIAGDLHLFAARRAFGHVRDPNAWQAAHPGRPASDRVVDLGTVAVRDGESELEIRLPEDWNRLPD